MSWSIHIPWWTLPIAWLSLCAFFGVCQGIGMAVIEAVRYHKESE